MPAVRLRSLPAQIGLLDAAEGADGVTFTATKVVPAGPVGHPGTVAETEYVPAAAVLTPAMTGFCKVEVKLLGPFQL